MEQQRGRSVRRGDRRQACPLSEELPLRQVTPAITVTPLGSRRCPSRVIQPRSRVSRAVEGKFSTLPETSDNTKPFQRQSNKRGRAEAQNDQQKIRPEYVFGDVNDDTTFEMNKIQHALEGLYINPQKIETVLKKNRTFHSSRLSSRLPRLKAICGEDGQRQQPVFSKGKDQTSLQNIPQRNPKSFIVQGHEYELPKTTASLGRAVIGQQRFRINEQQLERGRGFRLERIYPRFFQNRRGGRGEPTGLNMVGNK
ncbi:unnamed protein product, partial [Larinioides sclopetarius]